MSTKTAVKRLDLFKITIWGVALITSSAIVVFTAILLTSFFLGHHHVS